MAHTTASDALWCGVPVVRIGETFASRVAASILHAIDLPQLVVETPQDDVALALRLPAIGRSFSGSRPISTGCA